jgi:hypothetical protein
VVEALFDVFSSEGTLTTDVLRHSIAETVPLSKTMSEELVRLRNWATGRSRLATGSRTAAGDGSRRKIEL